MKLVATYDMKQGEGLRGPGRGRAASGGHAADAQDVCRAALPQQKAYRGVRQARQQPPGTGSSSMLRGAVLYIRPAYVTNIPVKVRACSVLRSPQR